MSVLCGSEARTHSRVVTDKMELLEEAKAWQRRPDYPGDVRNLVSRTKRSRLGALAREVQDYAGSA